MLVCQMLIKCFVLKTIVPQQSKFILKVVEILAKICFALLISIPIVSSLVYRYRSDKAVTARVLGSASPLQFTHINTPLPTTKHHTLSISPLRLTHPASQGLHCSLTATRLTLMWHSGK